MNRHQTEWSALAHVYNPLAAGSIDGTDEDPHDRAIIRAMSAKYKPNQGVQGDPQCTVFVAQLNHITTEDTLQMVFSQYGQIKRLRIIRDVVTGFSKGYAFVEYEDERDAVIAQREANGQELDDKKLFVDFENERTMSGWIPRRLGGGFGGKRESGQLRFGGRARPFKKPLLAAGFTGEKTSDSGNINSYRSARDDSDHRRNDSNRNQRYRSFDHRDRSRSPSRSHDSYRRRRRSRSRSKTRDRYRHRSRSPSRNRDSYKRR